MNNLWCIIAILLVLAVTHQQTESAQLTVLNEVNPVDVTHLNLSFTASTTRPTFQLFTRRAELQYRLVNPQAKSTYFIIEPTTGVVCEEITLIFTNPQSILNGGLTPASYILTTSVLNANVPPMTIVFWVYGAAILLACLYGMAGLMLLEFTQISILASSNIVLTRTFTNLLYDIMFFRWGAPWFTTLDSDCFLNNALVIIVILATVAIAALVVRSLLGQGANRYPKLKYFFNYNLVILAYHMVFLPLCVSISRDLSLLGRRTETTNTMMIINHVVCVLFLALVLFSFYGVGRILNAKHEDTTSTFYRIYSKLFVDVRIKRWYRRNNKLFSMLRLAWIAVSFQLSVCIFIIAIQQAVKMFATFTIQFYTSRLYNKFCTYVSVAIFVQYIVYTMEFMFHYMSATLLGYQGTVIIEYLAIGLYTLNSIAILGLSVYEAVVRLRNWIRKKDSSAKGDEMMVEMVETNREAQDSLLTKNPVEFEDASPVRKKRHIE